MVLIKYGVILLYVFACILKLFSAIFEMRVVTLLVPGRNLLYSRLVSALPPLGTMVSFTVNATLTTY